jgi:hypothetical protein
MHAERTPNEICLTETKSKDRERVSVGDRAGDAYSLSLPAHVGFEHAGREGRPERERERFRGKKLGPPRWFQHFRFSFKRKK